MKIAYALASMTSDNCLHIAEHHVTQTRLGVYTVDTRSVSTKDALGNMFQTHGAYKEKDYWVNRRD
jgi:hypothetical protein